MRNVEKLHPSGIDAEGVMPFPEFAPSAHHTLERYLGALDQAQRNLMKVAARHGMSINGENPGLFRFVDPALHSLIFSKLQRGGPFAISSIREIGAGVSLDSQSEGFDYGAPWGTRLIKALLGVLNFPYIAVEVCEARGTLHKEVEAKFGLSVENNFCDPDQSDLVFLRNGSPTSMTSDAFTQFREAIAALLNPQGLAVIEFDNLSVGSSLGTLSLGSLVIFSDGSARATRDPYSKSVTSLLTDVYQWGGRVVKLSTAPIPPSVDIVHNESLIPGLVFPVEWYKRISDRLATYPGTTPRFPLNGINAEFE